VAKTVYQANEWLAKANGASRKEFANFLMTRGISSFLGENIELYIRETTAGNQSSLPVKVKRTVAVARRMSKEQGYNIDAIIPPRSKKYLNQIQSKFKTPLESNNASEFLT
jgi:hypothetical protein